MLCDFQRVQDLNEWHCPVCNFFAFTDALPERECDLRPINVDPRKQKRARRSNRSAVPDAARDPLETENQYLQIIQPCPHRGEVIQTEVPCEACGQKGQLYSIYRCQLHGQCSLGQRRIAGDTSVKACITCPDGPNIALANQEPRTKNEEPVPTTDNASFIVVPTQGGERAWEGVSTPHPRAYDATAVIPVIQPDESLTLVIELLRLQTERPYILLIDTGSKLETRTWLESLRAADVEIHYIRKHGVNHSSELVSMALDVGVAVALSRYLFYTHADCFLRRRDAIEELKALASNHAVAGHQITERPYEGWESEFGHTLLMVDQWAMQRAGIKWSMAAWARELGIDDYGNKDLPANFVDTERGFNRGLQAAGIPGQFTGTETNFERNVDDWIDHVRSFSSSAIYSQAYQAEKALAWMADAKREAAERIKEWKASRGR